MRTTGRALGRLLPLIALAAGPVVLGGASVAGAAPTDVPFTTVGSTTWTVPNGVSCVTVDAIGARGGDGDLSTDSASAANGVNGSSVHAASTGGNGGEAVSTIEVLAGQVLQVNVGGRGQDA